MANSLGSVWIDFTSFCCHQPRAKLTRRARSTRGKRAAEFALDLASGPAASASAVTLQAELAQNSPETLRGVLARAQADGYLFARKFSRSCDRMLAIEMARGWPAR